MRAPSDGCLQHSWRFCSSLRSENQHRSFDKMVLAFPKIKRAFMRIKEVFDSFDAVR